MSDGRTHDEGCERAHHDCALARLDEARKKMQAAIRERDQMQSVAVAMSKINPGASGTKTAAGVYWERAEKAEAERDRLREAVSDAVRSSDRIAAAIQMSPTIRTAVQRLGDRMRAALAGVKESRAIDVNTSGKNPPVVPPPQTITLTRAKLRALVERAVLAGFNGACIGGAGEVPTKIAARLLADWEAKR